MKSNATALASLIVAFLTMHVPDVSAGCLDPARKAVEQEGMVQRLNSYAEEATVCIEKGFLQQNDCEKCRAGFIHRCSSGKWEPLSWKSCGAQENDSGLPGDQRAASSLLARVQAKRAQIISTERGFLDQKSQVFEDWKPTPNVPESSPPRPQSYGSSLTVSPITPAGAGTAGASTKNCPTTLAHLANRLPAYDEPELTRLRAMVLQTNLNDAIREAKRQGFTTASAAAASVAQAREFDRSLKSAETCIRQASSDPESIIAQLRDGSFRFGGRSGISTECARAYVAMYYAVVANRESAVALTCLAQE